MVTLGLRKYLQHMHTKSFCTCMGETAAAGGVFMGLGLRGVRGIGAAEAVGVTEAPLEGGPKLRGPTHSAQFRPAPHM